MQLDLTKVRTPRDHIDRVYPAAAFDATGDAFTVAGEIRLAFDVEQQDGQIRLVGTVSAQLEMPCSRCLEPMAWPVDAAFDLQYLPASANRGEEEREVATEELGLAFYDGEAIDLAQLLREQFYLALPMKPLCRPGCAGLCPECGTNLNLGQCACEHRWVDPRMAVLERLLPKEPREP